MTRTLKSSWFWILFALTVFTRFYFLTNKPIHFDEGINGWFVLQLQKNGFYTYDPSNYHGPLYFYLLDFWTTLFGHTMTTLRSLPAVFSVMTVLLFWRTSRWMSLFLLISPMMIFYGRSGIHETSFVFFQCFFFLGLWKFREDERYVHLFLALAGLWGMLCLKETFVLTFASVLVGFAFGGFPWKKFFREGLPALWFPILFFVLLWALIFSGFTQDPSGIKNFFIAFTPWLKTGSEGAGHEKTFWYWLEMMKQVEPIALAGVVAAFMGLFSRWRALAIFALVQLGVYSWIPYKTPWCVVSVVWPLYLCLAFAVRDRWSKSSLKWPLAFVFASAVIYQGNQLWVSVYRDPIDLNHPLVYVNSTYQFKEFNQKIVDELEKHPSRRSEIIQISITENWPLPWTLHKSEGLRYDQLRKNFLPGAWIYFCDASDEDLLRSRLGEDAKKYRVSALVIRQSTMPIWVWWRED